MQFHISCSLKCTYIIISNKACVFDDNKKSSEILDLIIHPPTWGTIQSGPLLPMFNIKGRECIGGKVANVR